MCTEPERFSPYTVARPVCPADSSRSARPCAAHAKIALYGRKAGSDTMPPSASGEASEPRSLSDAGSPGRNATAQDVLQAIALNSIDAIFAKDLDGRYLLFNPEAAGIAGRSPEAVIGQCDAVVFGSDAAAAIGRVPGSGVSLQPRDWSVQATPSARCRRRAAVLGVFLRRRPRGKDVRDQGPSLRHHRPRSYRRTEVGRLAAWQAVCAGQRSAALAVVRA